jgi:hypothetical protein
MFRWVLTGWFFKWVGSAVLSATVLWAVASALPQRSDVVVHVRECDVDLSVDGLTIHVVAGFMQPIVLELDAGRHSLRLTRDGVLLHEEEFVLENGQDAVLTAWDSRHPPASKPRAELTRKRGR